MGHVPGIHRIACLLLVAVWLSGCATTAVSQAAPEDASAGEDPDSGQEQPTEPASPGPEPPADPPGNEPEPGQNNTQPPPVANETGEPSNETAPEPAASRPTWFDGAPTSQHKIRPGMSSWGCTTNFLFHENWTRYFIGSAAHCEAGTNGGESCAGQSAAYGSNVPMEFGFTFTLAYSSYQGMASSGLEDPNRCAGDDFALLEIPVELWPLMHPKAYGIVGDVTGLGDCRDYPASSDNPLVASDHPIVGYGRSSLRHGSGIGPREPNDPVDDKQGYMFGHQAGGFECDVYLITPGIPGDSGGMIATPEGLALGAASTVQVAPMPGSNVYTNIARSLESMLEYEGWVVELVTSATD